METLGMSSFSGASISGLCARLASSAAAKRERSRASSACFIPHKKMDVNRHSMPGTAATTRDAVTANSGPEEGRSLVPIAHVPWGPEAAASASGMEHMRSLNDRVFMSKRYIYPPPGPTGQAYPARCCSKRASACSPCFNASGVAFIYS